MDRKSSGVGRFFLGVLAVALAVASAGPARAAAPDSVVGRLDALEAGAAAAQAQIAALQAAVAALQSENAALADQIADLQAVDAGHDARLAALDAQVAALQAALADFVLCPVGEAPVCCPEGTTFCGGACVDLDQDAANCGACGTACGGGQECVAGVCGLACQTAADCGPVGDTCAAGVCSCGDETPCAGGAVCADSTCTLCGNGAVDAGEACDDGNADPDDHCANDCTPGPCAPEALFAVGIYGTTTCAQRCAAEGSVCVGIGTDEFASDGLYNDCGTATSGIASQTAPGTCDTVLGGQGCSEFTRCACAPVAETQVQFAVGIFGSTTCDGNCAALGGTCLGIGTDDGATNGLYFECGQATSGIGSTQVQGGCGTVLGGQGCSEYTSCQCLVPDDTCTDTVFAVGIFGSTTCAGNCAAQGGVCVGIGTDDGGLNGQYFECGTAISGIGTTPTAGTCDTVLGGEGCSEYTTCRCYF